RPRRLEDAMTREDIENLAAAAESVKAQCNLDDKVCDEVSARFLSAIHASKNNPRFRLRRIALATTAIILVAQFSGPSVRAEPSDKPIGILLAAGDIAECKPGNPKGRPPDGYRQHLTANLLGKEISDAKARGVPIRVLALGDLAYDEGTTDQFENCFHKTWGQHIKYILPVPGNHEYKSKSLSENIRRDYKVFGA